MTLRRVLAFGQRAGQCLARLLVAEAGKVADHRRHPGDTGNDHSFLDDKALDTADEQRAVIVQALGLGCRVGALHRRPVIVPEFGDAVDFDIGRRDVGPGPLVEDVRLHIAPHPRHGVGQGAVHLEPMLDEVFVAEAVLAGQAARCS